MYQGPRDPKMHGGGAHLVFPSVPGVPGLPPDLDVRGRGKTPQHLLGSMRRIWQAAAQASRPPALRSLGVAVMLRCVTATSGRSPLYLT